MRTALGALALALSSFVFANTAAAAVPASERAALLGFYAALGGENWSNRTGWGGAAGTECTWFGVSCNEAGTSVTEISLPTNGLAGVIPESLTALPNLQVLYLPQNDLNGEIPSFIGDLTALRTLTLSEGNLTGEIPSSIGNLRNLEYLELYDNSLTGPLPSSISNLTSLIQFYIYDNGLTGEIPSSLGQLTKLEALSLAANEFSGPIPASLGALSNLEYLYLGANQLTGTIPVELAGLTKLRTLQLAENALTGPIPPQIGSMASLEYLALCCNAFSGSLPSQLASLNKLLVLDLYDNELTGAIPPQLGSMPALQELYLDFNGISGAIPPQIAGARELVYLTLDSNQLTGSIPREIGSMPKLEHFSIWNNRVSGTIPAELASATALRELWLSENDLTGPLPDLSPLKQLAVLDVSDNLLGGTIPSWLGTLPNMRFIGMANTGVSGTLPSELAALKNLEDLYLWGNELTGEIPAWLGDIPSMEALLLGDNGFTGPFPASLTKLGNLTYLDLQGNLLTGALPANFGDLVRLQYLSLGSNLLSGELPSSMSNMHALVDVRLEYNDFTGPLPSFAGASELFVLLTQANHFSGPFPVELTDLQKLEVLSLGANRFSGPIPAAIGKMQGLVNFDFSQNAFSGELPVEFMQLTRLADSGNDLDFNALRTGNAALKAFLDQKNHDGNWSDTQTQPPTGVSVSELTDRSAVVSWKVVPYVYDDGGYQVTATPRGGGASVIAATSNKEEESIIVRGLAASTTYDFTVRTVTHPNGFQQNLLISEPTASVSGATTPRVIAPAEFDITVQPSGLVQVGGSPRNEDSYIVTNFGDQPTSITTHVTHPFFTVAPTTFTLPGGASQLVRVTSVAGQAQGFQEGYAVLDGPGAPDGGAVAIVRLLSVTVPAGTVQAEPTSSRVEVSGAVGVETVGQVAFRNAGTAPLTGMLVSDEPWISVPSYVVTIQPNEIGTLGFTVVRAKRPDAGSVGTLSGVIRLLYVDSAAGGKLDSGLTLSEIPGVGASTVTVVDTARPAVQAGTVPPIPTGEVAHFIAGIFSGATASGRFATDVSMTNDGGTRRIEDLRAFFVGASGTPSSATLGAIATDRALDLANVASSVYNSSENGTVQVRTANWRNLRVAATSLFVHGNGTQREALPIFRSDRATRAGAETAITGLRDGGGFRTRLYLQEVSGSASTATIQYLNAAGAVVGSPSSVTLDKPFALVDAGLAPAGAVSVLVRNAEGSAGRFVAFARLRADATGEEWTLVDSAQLHDYLPKEPVRIPFAATGGGQRSRPRPVKPGSGTTREANAVASPLATRITIFNSSNLTTTGTLRFIPENGTPSEVGLSFAPHQTLDFTDVVRGLFGRSTARGQLTFTPSRGTFAVTASVGGASDLAMLPVVGVSSGLRAGQRRLFASVEQAAPEASTESIPATSRVALLLGETGGSAVNVRVRITLADAQALTGTTFSRDFAVAADSLVTIDDLASAVIGSSRPTYGNIHGARVQIDVIGGSGAVLPSLIVTDNGSGDSFVRLD
jgi:Leucine-rich repeat (LRR) protein